jgi:4-alpha-glucanotransferase
MALKAENGGQRWWVEWPAPVARRQAPALGAARERLAEALDRRAFRSISFPRANGRPRALTPIRKASQIVGDLPIFVAHDSAGRLGAAPICSNSDALAAIP